MTFKEITTVEALETLDPDLIVMGYRAGFKNQPDYTRRDQSYWHGFLNGQVDGGYAVKSQEQAQLARAVVNRWGAN